MTLDQVHTQLLVYLSLAATYQKKVRLPLTCPRLQQLLSTLEADAACARNLDDAKLAHDLLHGHALRTGDKQEYESNGANREHKLDAQHRERKSEGPPVLKTPCTAMYNTQGACRNTIQMEHTGQHKSCKWKLKARHQANGK
eukprot:scaffold254643_cov18-Tisochrysis_lutea.AAC.1